MLINGRAPPEDAIVIGELDGAGKVPDAVGVVGVAGAVGPVTAVPGLGAGKGVPVVGESGIGLSL